jgi:hypothetical protein
VLQGRSFHYTNTDKSKQYEIHIKAYIGRGIVILLVGLVLSITAMQYFSNKLTQGVQVTSPAEAGTTAD